MEHCLAFVKNRFRAHLELGPNSIAPHHRDTVMIADGETTAAAASSHDQTQ
jgi:hypothetical protein